MDKITTEITSNELAKLGIESEKPKKPKSDLVGEAMKRQAKRKTEIQATMFDEMPALPDFLDRRPAKVDNRAKDWTPMPVPHTFKPEHGDIKSRLDNLRQQFVCKSGQADAVIEREDLMAMAAEITTQIGDMLECCGLIYSSAEAPKKMRELMFDYMTMHTKHYNGQMYRYVCVVSDAQ